MLKVGRLRHRIKFQKQVEYQNTDSGALVVDWVDVTTVWGDIAPVSGKEFAASQTEFSKVTTRITVRYRSDITAKMRAVHVLNGVNRYYNIEAILTDKESGLEYMTLPCSEGVRYEEGDAAGVVPVNVIAPEISGNPSVGETIEADSGVWVNRPASFTYQWFLNDVPISGASGTISSAYILEEDGSQILNEDLDGYIVSESMTPITVVVPNNAGSQLKIGIVGSNSEGDGEIAYSTPVTVVA